MCVHVYMMKKNLKWVKAWVQNEPFLLSQKWFFSSLTSLDANNNLKFSTNISIADLN